MKILFLAYACEPGAGSEYGVGWNVPAIMATQYPEDQIYVLTRSRCREKIENCLPSFPNLHFLFYDIPSWMTYKNEMQSNWGEQINYLFWQIMVRRYLKREHKKIGFDIIHHLTFNQYRTPSPAFWMDVPMVMGPIGGAECIAPAFWQDLGEVTRKKEKIRKKGRDLKIFGWWCSRRKNRKTILFSSQENLLRLSPYCKNASVSYMPAIAYDQQDFDNITTPNKEKSHAFELIYAGKALDWKGLHIFLRAVQKAYIDNGITDFVIKLIGIRFEEEKKLVDGWIRECHLENHVELIPFILRSDLLGMLSTCDLSVYPAFRDSGSMSVLEASALGCPTLCFNAGGQDVFPDDILLKVKVEDTYEANLNSLADKLRWTKDNPKELQEIGTRSKAWVAKNLTWEKRVTDFKDIYAKMLNGNK